MKRVILFFCLVVVSMCALAETSSGQILFRRLWQRRKAEIRSEVYGQVYHRVSNELAAKMDSDLSTQMEEVKGQLKQAAEQLIASEAEKLTDQVQSELTKLHEEAQKLVTAEADKMQQEALGQIKKLREEAQASVAEESKRLDEQLKTRVAKIGEDNRQQIEAAIAKAATTFERFKVELSDQVAAEVQKQTAGVKAQVIAEIKAAGEAGGGGNQQNSAANQPEPAPTEPPTDTDKAIPPKPVTLVDEEATGDAGGQ